MYEPQAAAKPKRIVSYNQDAVLCPGCKKRIRLNNNGRIRTHKSGKLGSDNCMGSNAEPMTVTTFADIENKIEEDQKSTEPMPFRKEDQPPLFSDLA